MAQTRATSASADGDRLLAPRPRGSSARTIGGTSGGLPELTSMTRSSTRADGGGSAGPGGSQPMTRAGLEMANQTKTYQLAQYISALDEVCGDMATILQHLDAAAGPSVSGGSEARGGAATASAGPSGVVLPRPLAAVLCRPGCSGSRRRLRPPTGTARRRPLRGRGPRRVSRLDCFGSRVARRPRFRSRVGAGLRR